MLFLLREEFRQTNGRFSAFLLDVGLTRPRPPVEPAEPVSETKLAEVADALVAAGPLSELIIADREGR